MKYKTVREGQQALIIDHLGRGNVIVGPQRVFLYRKRLEFLTDYCASQREYIVIHDKDGLLTHKPGPCQMFFNPLSHSEISVKAAIILDSTQVIVVYKKSNDLVTRRLVTGPQVFIPDASEWLHQFTWHGPDQNDKTRIIPFQREFTKLNIIPENMYYNVKEVRTKDDTTLTLKIMLFYELREPDTMLTLTHDPIADIINAVCADMVAFAAKLTYAEFLSQSSELSSLTSYPQMVQRAERIGFDINKVVYRGYQASRELQAMQDNAIKSQTKLRLNTEVEEQQQRLAQFKLQREEARSKQKQEMEICLHDHNQQLDSIKQEHHLQLSSMAHHHQVALTHATMLAKLELEEARIIAEESYLKDLNAMNVDMTKFLVNQTSSPINKELSIVSVP